MNNKKEYHPFTTKLTDETLKGLKVKAAKEGKFLVEVVNEVIKKGLKL